jgi:hypothetical protein
MTFSFAVNEMQASHLGSPRAKRAEFACRKFAAGQGIRFAAYSIRNRRLNQVFEFHRRTITDDRSDLKTRSPPKCGNDSFAGGDL